MSLDEIDQELHLQVKIVMVGDVNVGKTSIVKRICNKNLPHKSIPTIGVEFQSTSIMMKSKNIQINIWDTYIQFNDSTVIKTKHRHYRKANGAIIVYDVSKRKSFLNCSKWLSCFDLNNIEIIEKSPDDISILLLGNKLDRCQFRTSHVQLVEQFEDNVRQVQKEQAMKFAAENNLIFGEVSAVTGYNIQPLMHQLIQKISSKMITEDEHPISNLLDNAPIKQSNSCCKC